MKRYQLFEFTDLPWWPDVFRSFLTDYLQLLMDVTRPFSPKASLIRDALTATHQTSVIDLCSGSAGPWLHLAGQLKDHMGKDVSVLLTDKFPNPTTAETIQATQGLEYCRESVDAVAVPRSLEGVRTLFNGFHHFPPPSAAAILRDAVDNRQAIIIFEILQRSWFELFYTLLAPFNMLLLTPWIRPRTVPRFLFTYVIPLAPIVALWDGLVSVMRCYTPDELLRMAHQTGADDYCWQAGRYRQHGLPVTYLVGYPTNRTAEPK